MKRFVIVLLAIAVASFAFAGGTCFKGYLNVGVNEPGMLGTGIGAYWHNGTDLGVDVKLGVRKHLNDYYEMPEALPLEVQLGIGAQYNPARTDHISPQEDLIAFTLNADLLYAVDRVVPVPVIDISPFIGVQYDFQMYETWNAHMVGIQAGIMFDVDLSRRMAIELVLGNPFNFDFSPVITTAFTSQAYANLGLSYVFGD